MKYVPNNSCRENAYRIPRFTPAKLGRSAFSGGGTKPSMNTAMSDATKVTRSIAYATAGPRVTAITPATEMLMIAPMLHRIEFNAITAAMCSAGTTF